MEPSNRAIESSNEAIQTLKWLRPREWLPMEPAVSAAGSFRAVSANAPVDSCELSHGRGFEQFHSWEDS